MKRIVMLATLISFALTGAAAARADKEEILKQYNRTGKMENCLQLNRIDRTKVLDDSTILFYMLGNAVYLNELPHRCPQLGFYETYMYDTSINQLCNTEIITVLDTAVNMRLASCGLGKFELLDKKKEPEKEKKESE